MAAARGADIRKSTVATTTRSGAGLALTISGSSRKSVWKDSRSGLSWLTILKKRDNFRAAFANFDFHQVAAFTADDEARCVADAGIVRHRGKIRSTINNAQRALDLVAEFGSLAAYFWSWEPTERDYPGVVSQTPDSIALSKDLRRRGWTFVGPTTAYAFMQAMGLVNDHPPACSARTTCTLARNSFIKPVCKVPPTPG